MNRTEFWSEEYPSKDKEEKINFWCGYLHQQIRWNVESGIDALDVFSKSDYNFFKSKDPNFDELLPRIIQKLGLDEGDVLKALNE